MADPVPPAAEPQPPTAPPLPAELVPAEQALERGNFRQARRLLAEILDAEPAPSPELAAAARELRVATDNDPWAVRCGLIATGLLALIVGTYIL